MKAETHLIHTPEEMHLLGKHLATKHKILFLEWELWAWKTTFAKGFAEWLGIHPDKVQSPTYTYINIYEENLLHIDLLRIQEFEQLVQKGIIEEIQNFSHILIEWPKYTEHLPLIETVTVTIKKTSPTSREVIVIKS